MIAPLLRAHLQPVADRHRQLRLRLGLAIWWGVVGGGVLLFILLYRLTGWWSTWTLPLATAVAIVGTAAVFLRNRLWHPNYLEIARRIEQQHPQLHALLRTAVEQQPDPDTGKLNYLQERVIQDAAAQSEQHRLLDAISNGRLAAAGLSQLAALILLLVALAGLPLGSPSKNSTSVATGGNGVVVTPGDVSLERGHGIAILARFEGTLPAEVNLVLSTPNEPDRRIPLVKSLDDPVFGGTIPEVLSDLTYRVEYSGDQTRDFKITTFEHPRLERADAVITYPAYTSQKQKRIDDTRRVSAVEGSTIQFSLQLNKPVTNAVLIGKDKSVVRLAIDPDKPAVALDQFKLEKTQTYDLQLTDSDGRTNKMPAQFVMNALKNRAPELKLASPRGDQRLSALEEVNFAVETWDDFGLSQAGLTYTVAGKEPESIVLTTNGGPNEKRTLNYLLRLEDLEVKVDDLVTYFVWADDIGPDGETRRTSGDMYFAEVRPFEEIYREQQQASPSGGQPASAGQQQAQDTSKLTEVQKQIINATWKLKRREIAGNPPSAEYQRDEIVVRDSQKEALDRASGLKEKAADSRSIELWGKVEEAMGQALKHLDAATNSLAPLAPALVAEQAAYQALLRLQAHQYNVSRSQNQNQARNGGGGNQRNQQQLNQLELKQSENRYEKERQAAAQQGGEKQEQLQVLNRLKELAQRQQDLNERLKELQTALQQAQTEQQREEIKRRLKRLREEEQQMLADLDEMRERMARPENQSRMAESREQLEQTRSEVQRAAEALENESVSKALSSATRAQRELEEMRDDFRKKHSNQFADEMREMRNDARQLAEKQDEVSRKLESLSQDKRKTLTDTGESKELIDQLQQQKQGVTNLLDQISRVTQEAETVEPLLAQQLYDTFRKTSQGNLDNALSVTSELLKRRFVPEARQFEQQANREVQNLKEGVERAAQSILGDDTEALRLARQEIDNLTRQLQAEAARATGGRQGSTNSGQTNLVAGASGNSSNSNRLANAGSGGTNDQARAAAGRDRAGEQAQRSNSGQEQASANGQSPSEGGQQQQQPSDAAGQQQRGPGNGQARSAQSAQAGQRGENSPGQASSPSPGQNPGEQGGGQQSAQNSSQNSRTPGNGQGGGQPVERQSTEANATQSSDRSPGTSAGQRQGRGNQRNDGGNPTPRRFFEGGPENDSGGNGGGGGNVGPLTGPEYTQWSDRMRNVEEMLDEPRLRNDVATIRERARAIRTDFKRHSLEPQWDLVKAQIIEPLAELRSRINEELARRQSKEALVPIDRDPVPQKFSDLVRRYYEKLGSASEETR